MLSSELENLTLERISTRGFEIIENSPSNIHVSFPSSMDTSNIAKSIVEILYFCGGIKDYGVQPTEKNLELWIKR